MLDGLIIKWCNATNYARDHITESNMNANAHELKLTDVLGRDLNQEDFNKVKEIAAKPLHNWIHVLAVSVGALYLLASISSLFLIVYNA